jgi:hypothetical protein
MGQISDFAARNAMSALLRIVLQTPKMACGDFSAKRGTKRPSMRFPVNAKSSVNFPVPAPRSMMVSAGGGRGARLGIFGPPRDVLAHLA